MTLEQWSYIGDIIAAAAVVASLIYLGIQIRQSNVLARAQTRQIMMQMGQQEIYKIFDEPDIWNLWTKEQLTSDEKVKLHCWLLANLRQREYEWLEKQEGIVDPKMFQSYAGVISLVLGTERTRNWWEVQGHDQPFDPEFIAYVDKLLEKSPLTNYFDSLDNL